MTMSSSVLATELETALNPVGTESAAINAWADAYANYAANAQAATPILAAGVALGKAAMITGLAGLSSTGAAALATGLRAFWTGVAGGLATSFAGATAITPTPMTGLEAALASAFATNNSPSVTLEDAAATLASAIHGVVTGGTVTVPPTTTPIT